VAPCAHCDSTKGVQLTPSLTTYPEPVLTAWDRILLDGEDPPDPNPPLWLCGQCAKDHYDYHMEMWREYHSGLL
jgi:hypothetical protein